MLLCGYCRDRLDKLEPEAHRIREALAAAPASERPTSWFAALRPRLLFAAGAIAIAIIGVFLLLHPKPVIAPLASLQLTAVRGDVQTIGVASETDLSLTDAEGPANLRAEVVNESGAVVWSASGTAGSLRIVKQLTPGTYFVRLYDSSGALLHEYAFRVRGNI